MKPLELTIYPQIELADDCLPRDRLKWAARREKERQAARAKHLTDAELAAEWHANEVEAWRMVSRRPEFYNIDVAEKLEARELTLHRFATTPHYLKEAA